MCTIAHKGNDYPSEYPQRDINFLIGTLCNVITFTPHIKASSHATYM